MRKHRRITDEPTRADLAAIEDEWPLIEAELDLVNAEIAHIYAADRGGPTELDWRRLRRAEARVTRVAAELAARPVVRRKTRAKQVPRVDAAPSPAELAAIQAEWPLIAAELDVRPAPRRAVA
ncbi:hypothetical protein EV385_3742 [Krasilnikovia cinnamomea]|uniref:Uncharacterized protein n=1 Tax=Krasilnikovia cinnamomea TaxID=349313 RepID=A0A4V2G7B6_9ACTN|nr:hypothetical protein EV385_3742 [Krasilnikovia cinnamomea]